MDVDGVDGVEGAVYESLPDEVVAGLEVRDAWRKELAANTAGLEFIVSDIVRWPVGSVVRVAFLDGTPTLHGEVASATTQIADAANLALDFGHDPASGTYRRWTTTDTEYAAEIRVSFDQGGYWSLLGTDSTDPTIVPSGPIGGRPSQRSLNLGGYKTSKPPGWQGTVRHEFLHALGFQHEHQNMRGPCQADFRWENDPGYVPTTNAQGVFGADVQGRRPGIYTYLAGPPNGWSRAKVDHNLKTQDNLDSVAGPFDPKSVMLYRFGKLFYESDPSPCAPTGPGLELSESDKRGLELLYPSTEALDGGLAEQSMRGLELLGAGEEGVGGDQPSAHVVRLVELLSLHAGTRP
jgi:hypothetical protein